MIRFNKKGKGLINSAIDFLGEKGVDLTLPTYSWCEPGTDVDKNLREGVKFKNLLYLAILPVNSIICNSITIVKMLK